MKLSTDNTLILVVDIQERLQPVLFDHNNFLSNCIKWLEGSTILNLPIIVTEQYPKGLGKTLPEIQSLIPQAPFFSKTQFSAWIDEVKQAIDTQYIKNIIVIGCETHICILQTVQDLCQVGLQVWIPQECVASRSLENKNNGLEQMQKMGAIISNIESLLFQLLHDAQHPNFKAISKLIQ